MPKDETERAQIDPRLLNPTDRANALQHAMFDVEKSAVGTLTWFGTAWVETLGQMGAEMVEFAGRRAREEARTQHDLLHCRSLPEVQRVQTRFLQTAIDQYTAEIGRFAALGTGAWLKVGPEAQQDAQNATSDDASAAGRTTENVPV